MDYNNALKSFNKITTSSASGEERIQQILELGNQYLGTSMAIISRVNKMIYKVYRHDSPPETLSTGQIFPLGVTYCQKTLAKDQLISVSHAKTSIFSDHPAYREMGLETYIGAPLKDNEGEQLGTLNFSASEKRELGFDAEHEAFVQKMADWLSSELIHQDDYVKA